MNKKRKNKLRKASCLLMEAISILAEVYDEENDCLDNTPENLQGSQRYEESECAIEALDEASDCISDAIEKIGGIVV